MTKKISPKHVLFLLFLFYSVSAQNLLISKEASALLAFKSKADSKNKLNFSPNTALAFCKWTGVRCDNKKPIRLILENLSLTGIFEPNTLTRLDQLRVLSLQNNSLTGPIPDLSNLINLKSLFLNRNLFSGSIPDSISTVHRLHIVDLSFNRLTGSIPDSLNNLYRLYYLRLDSNRFTGPVPFLNQTTLEIFNVSNNNLSGPVPVNPILLRFGPVSFLANPYLCGKIVERECVMTPPFFGVSSPPPIVAALSQTESTRSESTRSESTRTALIVGVSFGALIVIGSVLCVAARAFLPPKGRPCVAAGRWRWRRRGREKVGTAAGGMTDSDLLSVARHVARVEDEVGERVKRVEIVKSGILVFCVGESHDFTMDQLMRASAELLGKGSMGITYKAAIDDGRWIVSVKRLDGVRFGGVGKEEFERFMGSVGGLRHPNLVPMRAYFQAKEERIVVYDFQPNGSLFSLIHGSKSSRSRPLHWTSCLKIAEDIAQGLSYIHQAWRLVHNNLKSTNVLLGSDFEACLTDYCLSSLATSSPDPEENTHKSPEDQNPHHQTTPKSDVYSFGLLLLEILTGEPLPKILRLGLEDTINWVKSLREDDGEGVNRLGMLVEVAVMCSATSAEQRPTMWQVLKMIQEVKETAVVESGELLKAEGAFLD